MTTSISFGTHNFVTEFCLLAMAVGVSLPLHEARAKDPDMRATGVTVSDTTVDRGQTVRVRWTGKNVGDDGAGSTQQGVMWSTNTIIARGDRLLEKEFLGPISFPGNFFKLPSSSNEVHDVKIPGDASIGGTYYIGVYADYDRDESESNEKNNGSNAVKVTINDHRPDFVATGLTVEDSSAGIRAARGQALWVEWTAKNQGRETSKTQQQGVMWSTDRTITRSDLLLDDEFMIGIGANKTRTQGNSVKVPGNAVLGQTYYIGVYMDYERAIAERSEGNNDSNTVAVTVVADRPDLLANELTVADDIIQYGLGNHGSSISAAPGESIYLHWTAANWGVKGSGILGSQQGIMWSADSTVDRNDEVLERSFLGGLLSGQTTPEDQVVKVPADASIGDTYYIAIYSDYDRDESEIDEGNNVSNVVTVRVVMPEDIGQIADDVTDLWDRSEFPYLEDDDERRSTGGYVWNSSRCFVPGDTARLKTIIEHDDRALGSSLITRMTAYYSSSPSNTGLIRIGSSNTRDLDTKEEAPFYLTWKVPETPGRYYVKVVAEINQSPENIHSPQWKEAGSVWLDGQEPIVVTNNRPVILVHGWSDNDGGTFENLELLIETLLDRPVRHFHYPTAMFKSSGTGDHPRVDIGYNGKPSLATQLEEFLQSPEPGAAEIEELDLIAHSMGGLVARNYALIEPKIQRLITLGTPNYGGNFSSQFDGILNNQGEDLEYGCPLAWKLHQKWQARKGEMPEVLGIIGTDNYSLGNYNGSDVLVRCSSASLEGLGYPVYYVPLAHTSFGAQVFLKAMAQVDDTSHPCWAPIRRFLNGEEAPFTGEPGNLGGDDDVGDSSHLFALDSGMVLIAAQNGAPDRLASVHMDNVTWNKNSFFDVTQVGTHPSTGINYWVGRTADDSETGDGKHYTNYTVTVRPEGMPLQTATFNAYAGQTEVVILGDDGDSDDDLLPDTFEDQIIAASAADALRGYPDVRPDGDYDGDGLREVFELAFNRDPTRPDGAGVITSWIEDGFLVLRHPAVKASYISVSGEQSMNLKSWSPCENVRGVFSQGFPPSLVAIEWRIPVSGPDQFLRISAGPRE